MSDSTLSNTGSLNSFISVVEARGPFLKVSHSGEIQHFDEDAMNLAAESGDLMARAIKAVVDSIRAEYQVECEPASLDLKIVFPETPLPGPEFYTCIGKGGRYELLGETIGAGLSRGESVKVYRDSTSGQLFHRSADDFAARMERVA